MRLFELKTNTIIVMFAYSNPPTKEYREFYNEMGRLAARINTKSVVFLNPVRDPKLNPLGFKDNYDFNKEFFGDVEFSDKEFKSPKDILKELSSTYSSIIFLCKADERTIYEGLEIDALSMGFESYSIHVLNNGKNFNKTARNAALNDDFKTFKECFDTNDESLLARLYLSIRKAQNLDKPSSIEKNDENIVEKSIGKVLESSKGFSMFNAMLTEDKYGNKVYSDNRLKFVEMKSIKSPRVGEDVDGNKVVFVPELNTKYLKENKKTLGALFESTCSGSIATTPTILGKPINRTNVDKKIKEIVVDDKYNKLASMIRQFLNKNGYINSEVIEKMKKKL